MKNPDEKTLTNAADRKDNGESWKAILAETGLNYSQAWLYWAARTIEGTNLDMGEQATKTQIAEARNKGGEHASWGWLAVRAHMPESRVRKLYREATNIEDTGLRIGKGGRFVEDTEDYYVGDNRKTGVVTPVGEQRTVPERPGKDLTQLKIGQLNSLLKAAGLDATGKKADKIARLMEYKNSQQANA